MNILTILSSLQAPVLFVFIVCVSVLLALLLLLTACVPLASERFIQLLYALKNLYNGKANTPPRGRRAQKRVRKQRYMKGKRLWLRP